MARLICLSATIAMLCGLGIAHVHAATTHWVNIEETVPIPPGNGCEHAGYTTIQTAVTAASAATRSASAAVPTRAGDDPGRKEQSHASLRLALARDHQGAGAHARPEGHRPRIDVSERDDPRLRDQRSR